MKTILIVERARPKQMMLIEPLAERWRQAGHRVINHYGPRALPNADVAVLHVDATRVPEPYLRELRRFPVVVNREAVDISKARYSENIVQLHDHYAGPVIVKTDRNSGGLPELSRLRRVRDRLRPQGWARVDWLDPLKYPIFDRKEDVPDGAWVNPHLLVERFLPEREGDLFFVRYWIFFGDKGRACRFGSRTPIAKFSTRVTEEEPVTVPSALIELRQRLGVDYGRMDYVEHNGKPVVFDVNKTVSAGGDLDEYADGWDALASGIDDFLGRSATGSRATQPPRTA